MARIAVRLWLIEQMPHIRLLIKGKLLNFFPTSIFSKNRAVSTTSHRASLTIPFLIHIFRLPWPSTRLRCFISILQFITDMIYRDLLFAFPVNKIGIVDKGFPERILGKMLSSSCFFTGQP